MIVTPDNSTLIVAESLAGRLTAFDIAGDGSLSNRRVWAEGIGPDGICLDAEGAVWTQTFTGNVCARVREGGQVLESIKLDRSPFACMLGGPDGQTLFILAAEWRGIEKVDEALAARTGQVLITRARAPRGLAVISAQSLLAEPLTGRARDTWWARLSAQARLPARERCRQKGRLTWRCATTLSAR
jgi:sugar lactone lactonase YvrE